MAVNLIVLAVTLLMAGFFAVWCCCPWLRAWMEAPKYRILQWDDRSLADPQDTSKAHQATSSEGKKMDSKYLY